jgi:hypothetical protein
MCFRYLWEDSDQLVAQCHIIHSTILQSLLPRRQEVLKQPNSFNLYLLVQSKIF